MDKRRFVQMLLILFAAIAVDAAVGEYRIFHDSTGREIKARLLQFNPQSNEVKIQLGNRKIRTTEIAVFSAADQEFIRNWHISEVVFSEKNLIVTINKKSLSSERYRDKADGWKPKTPGMRVEEIAYELELESRNTMALKGMKAEYCIYHQRTEKGTWVVYEYEERPTREYDERYEAMEEYDPQKIENKRSLLGTQKIPDKTIPGTTAGELLIPELPRKGSYEGLTKAVPLRKGSESRPLEVKDGGYPAQRFPEIGKNPHQRIHEERKVEGKVVGVVFRVSVPLSSGGYAQKEYSYPKDLVEKKKVDWDALKPKPSAEGRKEAGKADS